MGVGFGHEEPFSQKGWVPPLWVENGCRHGLRVRAASPGSADPRSIPHAAPIK